MVSFICQHNTTDNDLDREIVYTKLMSMGNYLNKADCYGKTYLAVGSNIP